MKVSIKNMVCCRCITVVRQGFEKMHVTPVRVLMGEVELAEDLSIIQLCYLKNWLSEMGFELLDDRKMVLVERVKNLIIEIIHGADRVNLTIKLSYLIQQKIRIDYNYISSLFSNIEGITIEQYIILQRIERAKEFLEYNELTLSEIAHKLGYSSVQYLSTQFKKATGFTPSHFKKIKENTRKSLDKL
ncbi:helix-turn-helix transcriptional regulator [Pedobacter sp. PLR]|uniref:helix-turn-helix domain-containing protein n=1 Tax=Pedobacter sp. PLR TaxID=2994465 RepID=UPI0022466711|nr:helix-turn-helix transcriptional regulator [Pedobacter sp. PLR]MCX2452008.1 helix-turn-helix transcriptional regulator [Pedobacter sp. PLR]